MNLNHIKKSNQCAKRLKAKGFIVFGNSSDNFKTVVVIKNSKNYSKINNKVLYFKNFIEAYNSLIKMN